MKRSSPPGLGLGLESDRENAGGAADGAADMRNAATDLGLPPRLAAWLVKHKGGDARRAFNVATRGMRDRHVAPLPDADGHVALGRSRPKYASLEERRVEIRPAARPTPRPFDYEPLADRQRRLREDDLLRHVAAADGVVKVEKDNVATSSVARAAVARVMASVREKQGDFPKGATAHGRHEPIRGAGVATAYTSSNVETPCGRRGGGLQAVLGGLGLVGNRRGPGMADAPAAASPATPGGGEARRKAALEKAAEDAALLRLLPAGERPIIDQSAPVGGVSKVPRSLRQTTLDALVAAALRAEGAPSGLAVTSASASADIRAHDGTMDPRERWILTHPKSRERAVARGVAAEARVYEASQSKVTYRSLAARALRTDATATAAAEVAGSNPTSAETLPCVTVGGVVTEADAAAAAFLAAVVAKGKAFREKGKKGRALPHGLRAAAPGALAQGYRRAAAEAVNLTSARVVRGQASLAFFAAAALRRNPPPLRRVPVRPLRAEVAMTSGGERRRRESAVAAAPGSNPTAGGSIVVGRPEVIAAVRSFVAAYLDPLTHVGVVCLEASARIAEKVTAKVMRKHEKARDAAPFLAKEAEAIKSLARSYIQREQQTVEKSGRVRLDAGDGSGRTRERDGGEGGRRDASKRTKKEVIVDFNCDL